MSNFFYNALRVNFDYNYNLAKGSPNSNGGGKLTLTKMSFSGKDGTSLVPPYKFFYNNENVLYQKNDEDDWGYNKTPEVWSLKEIINPTGSRIRIDYESDSYRREALIKKNRNRSFWFTGDNTNNVNSNLWNFNKTDQRVTFNIKGYDGYYLQLQNLYKENNVVLYYKLSNGNEIRDIYEIENAELISTDSYNYKTFNIVLIKSDLTKFHDNLPNQFGPWDGSVNNLIRLDLRVEKETFTTEYYVSLPSGIYYDGSERIYGKNGKSGGGLRVKKISVLDSNNNETSLNYSYVNPFSNRISGITSYEPYDEPRDNPLSFLLPAPGVNYEYVTIESKNRVGQILSKKQFKFNVIKPLNVTHKSNLVGERDLFSYGNFLTLKNKFNNIISYTDEYNLTTKIDQYDYSIFSNLNKIGLINNIKEYNSLNHLIKSETYKYEENLDQDGQIGVRENSYYSFSSARQPLDHNYKISFVQEINYPSILKSKSIVQSGNSYETFYDKHDFLTGEVLETRTITSDGKTFKTKIVPAYTKYPQMASKVDDINNRNMLTQTAASYSYIQDAGDWKVTGVGITTWNNIWSYQDVGGDVSSPTIDREKIWRKHKSYVWNGVKDNNGIFIDYNDSNDDDFDWTVGVGSQPTHWKQASEITLYDHYSMPLEVKDVNNNKAATKMDVLNQKIEANGNAAYSEMYYSGAEIFSGGGFWVGQEVRNTNGIRTDEKAHTGKYSIAATNNSQFGVFMRNGHRPGKYKISVWAHKDNYQKARLRWYNNDAVNTFDFNGEKVFAGDWVLLNHYTDVHYMNNANAYWFVNSDDNSTVYFDDLMIRPIASSITGYVYNEYDELTHIIGNNGLATRFEYDAGGRLVKTYVEIVDDPANSVIGGFKLKSENKYHYKNL